MTNIPYDSADHNDEKMNALSEAVRAITAELSLEKILPRLAEITAQLVNARYAALGVPDNKGGLEAFYTYGMSENAIAKMDHYPRGLGLLGLLIVRPEPIRLANMRDDERSAGFCNYHPGMTSFLGVPIISKGVHLGSLYLSDRRDGQEFSQEDERLVQLLAGHAAIAIENARLSLQLQRLAVIDERDRISMELHDGIIQQIYAIGIKLELMRLKLNEFPDLQTQIMTTNHDLNHVIENLRKYIQDLKVGVDYSVELTEQLDEIAQGFREVSSARLVIDKAKGFAHLTPERLHGLVQIVREGLSNIVRHAKASEVYVDLHETASQLMLVISDNGQGFDPKSANVGNGLQNMRHRVRQLGGSVNIISKASRGTTVTVTIPISDR